MIIFYLLQFLVYLGSIITNVFGSVSVLPYGTDNYLVTFFGWFNYIKEQMWPLEGLMTVLGIYILWRFLNLILKFLLGQRAPIN